MSSTGSVSAWIAQLKAGEEQALDKLHQRYWPMLVELARQRLHGTSCRAADEEDVAQEALFGFFKSLKANRLPALTNRHQFLALVTHIIACGAANQFKREMKVQKRGQGRILDENAQQILLGTDQDGRGLQSLVDDSPTPVERAVLNDCYVHFVQALPEHLLPYAELHLAGYTHAEIGQQMNRSEQTVSRKLAIVMARWQRLAAIAIGADPG
jgi:RNA polymerase sigma factor (sigma-70 family)